MTLRDLDTLVCDAATLAEVGPHEMQIFEAFHKSPSIAACQTWGYPKWTTSASWLMFEKAMIKLFMALTKNFIVAESY